MAAASTVERSRHQLGDSRLDELVESVRELAAGVLASLRGDQFVDVLARVAGAAGDSSR